MFFVSENIFHKNKLPNTNSAGDNFDGIFLSPILVIILVKQYR